MARTTTHDVEIQETTVPAGEKILIYYAGANRDPREFPNPDAIDIDRASNRHLVFGAGPHRCIGSNLARVQILVAVDELLNSLQNICSAPNNEFHFHSGFSRGLTSLRIAFDASSSIGSGQGRSG
jgi:cytochrome P450